MPEDIREVTCTTCPVGCRVKVSMDGARPLSVSGNRCNRGVEYAMAEVTDPRRVITSTIWAMDGAGERKLLPVRTRSSVPKRLMFDIMKELAESRISLPVRVGDTIVPNVLGTGVDIVASRSLA